MAVAFRDALEQAYLARTELSMVKPVGAEEGDVMIVSIYMEPNGVAVTPPAGWTTLARVDSASGGFGVSTFYKRYEGEAGPFVFTWGAVSHPCAGLMLDYSGVGSVNVTSGAGSASSTTAEIGPSVTTTAANCEIVMLGTGAGGHAVTVVPAGMTGRFNEGFFVGDVLQAVAGVSGAKEATISAAAWNMGQLLALAPPVAASSLMLI